MYICIVSICLYSKCGFELPIDKIRQGLELSILTCTNWFFKMQPKLVSILLQVIPFMLN